MKKNMKHLFMFTTLLVLLVGLTAISAADVSDNSTAAADTQVQASASSSIDNVETVQQDDNNKIVQSTKVNTEKKQEVKKEVKKTNTKSVKQATVNREVNDFDELSVVADDINNDVSDNEYYIKVNKPFNCSSSIVIGTNNTSSVKKVTFDMNNHAIEKENGYWGSFLYIGKNCVFKLENTNFTFNSGAIINNGTLISSDDGLVVQEYQSESFIVNNGNFILENTTLKNNKYYELTQTYSGNLTLNNCTVPANCSIATAYMSSLNIYLNNCTVDSAIEATNIFISDNTVLTNNTLLNGRVITNKTGIVKYLGSYRGNYTAENMTLGGSSNSGNLTLINSKITGIPQFMNSGNLTLINSTVNVTSNFYNNGIITFANGSTLINTIENVGNLIISDDVVISDNAEISGRGNVYTNNTKVFLIMDYYNGTYTLNNSTLNTYKRNAGNLTLNNCTVNRALTNDINATLILNNCTINNTIDLDENSTVIISDDVVFGSGASLYKFKTANIITNKTGLEYYYSVYYDNCTLNNFTTTNYRRNYANLTLNNGTINGTFNNEVNSTLILNNCTINGQISTRANATAVLNNCMINGSISGASGANIIINDNCKFGKNAFIENSQTVNVVSNNTYVSQIIYTVPRILNNTNDSEIRIILTRGNYNSFSNSIINLTNQTCKNITIEGYQTINNNRYQFLIISPEFNVTLKNMEIVGYNNKTIDNNGILTLDNCILNTTLNNNGTLVISPNTILGSKASITGNGRILRETVIIADAVNDIKLGQTISVSGKILTANNTPLSNAAISLKLDDNTYNTTTDANGSYVASIPTSNVGTFTLTLTYNGNDDYLPSNATVTFNVEKHDTVLTVEPIATVHSGKQITVTGKLVDENGNVLPSRQIHMVVENVTQMQITNNNGTFTKVIQVNNVGTYNITLTYDGNDNYEASNVTTTYTVTKANTTVTIDPINGVLGRNISFVAHIVSENGTNVTGGFVVFKVNGVTLKDSNNNPIQVNVVNGTAVLTTTATWSTAKNTTVVYSGNDVYSDSRMDEGSISLVKQNVTVNVSINDNLKPGDNLIVTVNITDNDNNTVNAGKVVFKLNGKTLENVNVTNGQAVLNYTIPENYSPKTYNITVIFAGSIYNRADVTDNFTLSALDAKLTLNVTSENMKPGSQLIAVTNITDVNGNPVNRGKVLFKLNGKTLKDENNQTIEYNVTNGQAILNYTIPNTFSAKTYNLTAVFGGSNYNTVRVTQNITLQKTNIRIDAANVTINRNLVTVKANIINNETNTTASERPIKVSVKLDQRTIIKQTIVNNGIINLNTTLNYTPTGNHTVEIVSGENGLYNTGRLNVTI